ncbi:MAG: Holliday junction resolvase RuvX [Vampirovibrionales bacterium]|nr:Holliday junction resolvase RuvX [Vampirovibrionales bacterium]
MSESFNHADRILAGRILGVDIGTKRVGIAISDPLGNFAVGLETLEDYSRAQLLEKMAALCVQHDCHRIVFGLPKHMDGREGPEAERVRKLADSLLLLKPDLEIIFLDERLTSVMAHQTLRAQGIKASRNKGLVDQAAAKRILQDYLDKQHFK